MITYREGELLDLLPPVFREDPDWVAFSYALKMGMQKLLGYMDTTMMYAAIDEQPETILDYMATELRSPYYEESADIDTKRNIIKKTIEWYLKAGTKASVEELIRTVIGSEGTLVEWPDFEGGPGTPGTFDVETHAFLAEDTYDKFLRIIESQKDLTSHLRRILVRRNAGTKIYVGLAIKHTKDEAPTDLEPGIDPIDGLVWYEDEGNDLLMNENSEVLLEED